ncbi:hypothetical protein IFM89_036850, partial [Coptis chinensis]
GTVVEEEEDEDSWEMADLDKSMSRLLVSSKTTSGGVSKDDVNNQVDEFLREALQNPRERLSILRIEQDVVKFISNPSQQQLEFQQLPTSYLRLAAHRVAQHYQLESLGVLDNNVHDGFGSRIVVRKSSACQFPPIRLADIPLSLPHGDNNGSVKVAIKQRPGKCSESANNASRSSKWNHAKSVEERKEEYNRARARIFSSENGTKDEPSVLQPCSSRSKGVDERFIVQGPESPSKGYDSSTGRGRTEHDPAGRYKTNNKVAIFRDRDVDRKDPDYDRSYDRYAQRFDPGFGFNGGPYAIQPMYAPAVNYNSEFPQLGAAHQPQISIEHQSRQMPQHLGVPWAAASTHGAVGYAPPIQCRQHQILITLILPRPLESI